jgi:hypothetical protein
LAANQKVGHPCGNHHKGTEPADRRSVRADRTVALRAQANSIDNAKPPTAGLSAVLHFF